LLNQFKLNVIIVGVCSVDRTIVFDESPEARVKAQTRFALLTVEVCVTSSLLIVNVVTHLVVKDEDIERSVVFMRHTVITLAWFRNIKPFIIILSLALCDGVISTISVLGAIAGIVAHITLLAIEILITLGWARIWHVNIQTKNFIPDVVAAHSNWQLTRSVNVLPLTCLSVDSVVAAVAEVVATFFEADSFLTLVVCHEGSSLR
jgi:hypothetical protein